MKRSPRRPSSARLASLSVLRRLLGVGALLVASAACSSEDESSGAAGQGGAGGTGGASAGQGGASGKAGASAGSAGVAAGSAGASAGSAGAAAGGAGAAGATAGASGTTAGGTAGAASGGTAGAGGEPSTGGTAGTANGGAAGDPSSGGGAGDGGASGSDPGTAGASGDPSSGGASGSGMAGAGTAGAAGSAAGAGGSAGSAGAAGSGGQPAPLGGDACNGYATRYWDCCKPHCGWAGNVPQGVAPVTSCNAKDEPITGSNAANTPSSCNGPGPDSAYTCQSMAPWKVSDTLAYGYAAVPATGDICGRCYQVEFTGTSHNAGNDPGSAALKGKTMIVQATNIGYDVGNGQFDILIPGGGVGAFNACSYQWGQNDLGAQYGGFLLQCKQQNPGASHEASKACVKAKCDSVFKDASLGELHDACVWFTEWYETADNPNLRYAEVPCPDAIVQNSGVDRRPLNDIKACGGGGGGSNCSPEQQANCNCDWTNNGTTCGSDDGSCCWKACCGS